MVFAPSAGLAIRSKIDDDFGLATLRQELEKAPIDPDKLTSACHAIQQRAAGHGTENQAAMSAHPGLLDALVEATQQHVEHKWVAVECAEAIDSIVVFNPVDSIVEPAMEALMQAVHMYSHDEMVMGRLLPHIAGYTTFHAYKYIDQVLELGGFDALYNSFTDFPSSPSVQIAALMGLSDYSHCDAGASIEANHGGKNKGIEWLVKITQEFPSYKPEGHLLSLKYESMQLLNGILLHDQNNTYYDAFMQAGGPVAILKNMRDEPEKRAAQDVAINIIYSITKNPKTTAASMPVSDLQEAVSFAWARHGPIDRTPAWAGILSDVYPMALAEPLLAELSRLANDAATLA